MADKGFVKLSRRHFLGGAALMAGSLAAGCSFGGKNIKEEKKGAAPVEEAKTEIFSGACRGNCAGGCFLNVHVRDGQVVRTTARDLPNTEYNRICTRGLTHVHRIYSSQRVQYPMKRTGERGEGKFKRISWDEAYDEIAKKWKELTDADGPEAMAVMYGSGNYAICSGVGLAGGVNRFMNTVGCSYIPLNVDAAHGRAFGIIAGGGPYGTNNEPADYKNSKTFVCWGANPTISQPQVMHFIFDVKEKGGKYIVVDPVYNANTAKADWHIPVKASADGPLAFGALHEVFANDWQDLEFLRNSTEAPLLIKEDGKFMRMSDLGVEPKEGPVNPQTGKPALIDPLVVIEEETGEPVNVDEAKKPSLKDTTEVKGIKVKTAYALLKEKVAEYPLEKASELSGVPVEDIKELARVYAQEGPINTYALFGSDHYINGHYNYWPIYMLAYATGNACKPGAACGFAELLPSNVANFAVTMPKDKSGNKCKGQGRQVTINKVGEIQEKHEFDGKPLTIKGVYITNANPVVNMADHAYTTGWIKNMDFVVVADQTMTETAKYADILLPAAHWFEQVDLFTSFGSSPYITWNEKAIAPLYEAKPDFEIYRTLADKLGYKEFFDLEPEDFIKEWISSKGAESLGITFDSLKKDKVAKVLPGENFVSYSDGKFNTPTKRGRIYQEVVVPQYQVGQKIDESKEKTLYWEPAREASDTREIRKKFPFHIISEHMRTRTHSQWWDVKCLSEVDTGPVVKIGPKDAEEFGIKAGDKVKVYNDRGYVVLEAVINPGLPPKTLSAPRGFQIDEFIDGHFANLPMKDFNQVCANQAFNDVAVAIEKL